MESINVKSVEIHFRSVGSGVPIVFLHGNPADHRSMMSAFEPIFELHTEWQRIYVDLPGLGQTPGPDWINSNDQVLDVLLSFIDTVIPERRFLVAGESYGGYLARGIAHFRSERMDGLFLLSPVGVADPSARRLPERIVLYSEEEYVNSLPAELKMALGNVAVVHSRDIGDQLMKDYISAMRISDQTFLRRVRERYAFTFDQELLSTSHDFPTLIILGRQDGIVGYEDQLEFLKQFTRSTFAVLDRSGHVSELEQPLLFNALVNEWLDRTEEYIKTKETAFD